MNSCSMIRRPRSHPAALGVLLGLIAVLALGTRAQGAPASPPAKPSNAGVVSISGANLRHALTFRQSKQPAQYAQLLAEVSWMDDRAADIIPSRPPNLGPHYLVVAQNGSKTTGKYDLYPEVPGGPLAHRQALGSAPAAWFYAPIDMASALASLGVSMPTAAATDTALAHPAVATTALKQSLTSIAKESVTALGLAALGCVAILILLGFAARRSHAVDRRRTMSPAMGRLAEVSARAAQGRGAVRRGAALRGAAPGSRPAVPSSRSAPPSQTAPPDHATSSGSSDHAASNLAVPTTLSAPTGLLARVAKAKLAAGVRRTRWRSLLPPLSALPRPRRASDRRRS